MKAVKNNKMKQKKKKERKKKINFGLFSFFQR